MALRMVTVFAVMSDGQPLQLPARNHHERHVCKRGPLAPATLHSGFLFLFLFLFLVVLAWRFADGRGSGVSPCRAVKPPQPPGHPA